MQSALETLPLRSVGTWTFHSQHEYTNPFTDVVVEARFTAPGGRVFTQQAFFDGTDTWRVRFNPGEPGHWHYHLTSLPFDAALSGEGSFEVTPCQVRGFLRSTPGQHWGFQYESGEPVFLFGDTTYHLFGMAACGLDVQAFMQRRADQGFNILRARLPISPYHPPEAHNTWQTRHLWPWGGSEQIPRFDRFQLDYFRVVDQVVAQAEALHLGLELIMEGWGYEFPFNNRALFTAEWEELWLRYLVARYDAYGSVFLWTLLNEYECYPDGLLGYKAVADRFALRLGRWMKQVAAHDHIIAVHINQAEPPYAARFATDPEAIDTIMFQMPGWEYSDWLTRHPIEPQVKRSFAGWWGSAVFSEYGYERNPALPLLVPMHRDCDPNHSRYGAWQGAFCGMGVIHGFDNSWGIFGDLEHDQPGLVYLQHLHRFFTELVPFERLRPAQDLIVSSGYTPGLHPLALASANRDVIALYLPVGGSVALNLLSGCYAASWFNTRSGELHAQEAQPEQRAWTAPGEQEDWALILRHAQEIPPTRAHS